MNYGLPSDYISRLQPQYFNDTLEDTTYWQADVYRLAAILARKAGVKRLIDIGCGRAGKLIKYAKEFEITGYDFGGNIDYCQQAYPLGTWHPVDLNKDILSGDFRNSIVICADVIEHLPDPSALVASLRNAAQTAAYVLVSTPDRTRVKGANQGGMPHNPYHVREWSQNELVAWFKAEKLPIVWDGWTVSNDHRPEQIWTSLIVLSTQNFVGQIPIAYECNSKLSPPAPQKPMLKVWMTPTPNEARRDTTNSINNIVLYLDRHLPKFGVELVENPDNADLSAVHAGQGSVKPADVAHYHGLYPTAQDMDSAGYFAINANVIRNLKSAKAITAPSQWIADLIRRDMHIEPHIIGWAVDTDEWTPVDNPHVYVLWNKARVDAVCNPQVMLELAAKAHDVLFLTTFGEGTPNVKTIGRQPYAIMKEHVRNAAVYLSTNVETFGIGVAEAMAAGVPILGFRQGAIQDYVEHGKTGFLAELGDMEGLYEGLRYCLKHRKALGENAREAIKAYSWDRVAEQFANIYRSVLKPVEYPVKVSVVIPCHDYGRYVGQAIESVLNQQTNFPYEIIVVLDRCTDDSEDVVQSFANRGVKSLIVNHGNLSATRNSGIRAASGEYMVCLDADDRLGSPLFLQKLADALDNDTALGVAFTSIQFMNSEGELGHKSTWPDGYDVEKQVHRFNQIPSCCMFRKEAWKRAGGFKPYFVYAQDAEFWTQLSGLGYTARHVVNEGWFQYRLHNKSQSMAHRTGQVPEPDWTEYYAWSRDNERPFGADGKAPKGSWPVRFYNKPDVSVIIPVGKGHEQAVIDALHSVEGQTHRYWECIVVNDTGKSLDLMGFPFVKVITTRGGIGAGAARNMGSKAARAPFLAFLDADDMLKPHFIEKTLKAYRQHGKYIYTDWLTHDKQTDWQTHTAADYSFDVIREKPSIHLVSILIPRDWFNKIGGFDETLTAFEDVDLIMNLLIHGYCGRRIAEPLLIYNLNSGYRRLASEKKQADFKTLLIERYGDYMRGEKMCQCIDPPKGKKALPPTPDNVAEYRSQYGEMVMARLIWEDAPEAPVTFRGPATRVNYQSRAKGDVFYVWEQDILRSEGVFERLENYETTPMQTVAPPEPTLQGLDVHIIPGHAYPDLGNEVTVEIPDNEAELTEQIVSTMKPTAKAAKGKPGRKAKVR